MKYCPECKALLGVQLIDGLERKLCEAEDCSYVIWDNPVPVVAALVMYKGGILLARNSAWSEGVFSLVAGYLERFELPEVAIRREVKEELGLRPVEVNFIGHYPFREKNQLIIAYAVSAEGELQLSHEIAETEFVDFDMLAKKDFGTLTLTKDVVTDWLESRS